jgi:hypothetical protein
MLKHLNIDEMVGLIGPWANDATRKAQVKADCCTCSTTEEIASGELLPPSPGGRGRDGEGEVCGKVQHYPRARVKGRLERCSLRPAPLISYLPQRELPAPAAQPGWLT